MKITKNKLEQLVKEELNSVLNEKWEQQVPAGAELPKLASAYLQADQAVRTALKNMAAARKNLITQGFGGKGPAAASLLQVSAALNDSQLLVWMDRAIKALQSNPAAPAQKPAAAAQQPAAAQPTARE